MKLCTILGGVVGLAFVILGFLNLDQDISVIGAVVQDLGPILNLIVGLVVVALTLLVGIRPDDPIPFHWLVLFILGVLLIVFGGGVWACALLIIAALIGIIDKT